MIGVLSRRRRPPGGCGASVKRREAWWCGGGDDDGGVAHLANLEPLDGEAASSLVVEACALEQLDASIPVLRLELCLQFLHGHEGVSDEIVAHARIVVPHCSAWLCSAAEAMAWGERSLTVEEKLFSGIHLAILDCVQPGVMQLINTAE
jgi:hypothetical protein